MVAALGTSSAAARTAAASTTHSSLRGAAPLPRGPRAPRATPYLTAAAFNGAAAPHAPLPRRRPSLLAARPRAAGRPAAAAAAAAASAQLPAEADVVVVGAGLAGLHCAQLLQAAGLDAVLVEAADGPGGRVRTDVVDGFLLDRGFQIFLTGYPYCKEVGFGAGFGDDMAAGCCGWVNQQPTLHATPTRAHTPTNQVLDFDALNLKPFYAGARVWFDGRWHTVADPLRHLVDGLLSLTNPIGSVLDKVRLAIGAIGAVGAVAVAVVGWCIIETQLSRHIYSIHTCGPH